MIVRGLDQNGDFLFGKGKNDYKAANNAVEQSISTRLKSFLGDCFFATDEGIDWFNLLGGKDLTGLTLAIKARILNTPNVSGIISTSVNLSKDRKLSVSYTVTTQFSNQTTSVVRSISSFLLTESGEILVTEDGQGIEGG